MQAIVGLGGSAGSLGALRMFFSQMPGDNGLAFVVVVHLSPEHESALAALLQNVTSMRVVQVSEATTVQANCVYVIPPGKQLLMADGEIVLNDLRHERGKRAAVDFFFRSLADTHGSRSVAIVLSGVDGDGAIGIKRIKENGGLTVAQEPGEAEHEGMPRAAIATGMVDWVLPVAEMPKRLLEYQRIQERVRLPDEAPLELARVEESEDEHALRETLTMLRARTGHDFSCYKRGTILRRIRRRMQVNSIAELPAYLAFLRVHPNEATALLQDLLISVTNFFRDQDAFHALQAELPRLFASKKPGEQVRVWVPGCATGEEAYSIAILLSEYAAKLNGPPQIQVFATDLDDRSINIARTGFYPDAISADVSEERLRLFFFKESRGYRVNRGVRETLLFALHDLLKDPPFSRLDLVSCRNLLIYLNREAQRRAFDTFHFALRENGILFLGSSESIEDDATAPFITLDKRHRTYARPVGNHRSSPVGRHLLSFELGKRYSIPSIGVVESVSGSGNSPWSASSVVSVGGSQTWAELHFKMLERFAPPSVIVDGNYDIIHLSEHAGQYIRLGGGTSTLNLLRVVHPMLRTELRAALFQARQTGTPVKVSGVPLEIEGSHRAIDLLVNPAQDLATNFLLVVFDAKEDVVASEMKSARTAEPLLQHLETEIDQLKAQQREAAEHHEQSIEELKASNEELQAINEELRSATEELETSREELCSINEELRTVNQELENRVEEVGRANNDLHNLMASTNIATIFVDRDLLIKLYTPAALGLFRLIPSDLGRSLFDLQHRLEYDTIAADASDVLDRLTVVEREVRGIDNRWYFARLQPYRTTEGWVAGVVLTFVDITERKKANEQLRQSEERLRLVIDSVQDYAIYTLDVDGRVTTWNAGAARIKGYTESEIIGQNFAVLYPSDQVIAGIPEQLLATARIEGRAHRENWRVRKGGERFWGDELIVPLRAEGTGALLGYAKICRDLSERKAAEDERSRLLISEKTARQEAEAASVAKDNFLAALSHELRTPLTPVPFALSVLETKESISAKGMEAVNTIRRNIELASRLVNDLLDVSRIVHGKMDLSLTRLDLHECVRQALADSNSDLTIRELKLTLALEAVRHEVLGDAARLRQVFSNLLQNAAKFNQTGGSVTVRSRNRAGDRIVIEVIDTGIGIEAGGLQKIFDAFEQAGSASMRQNSGLGLGLTISQAIALAHGGSIVAQSNGRDQGTTLIVDLPALSEGPGTPKKD
jgi:two-component system CheB/CheR fusion protein